MFFKRPETKKVKIYHFNYSFCLKNGREQNYKSDGYDDIELAKNSSDKVLGAFNRAMKEGTIEWIDQNLMINGADLAMFWVGAVK